MLPIVNKSLFLRFEDKQITIDDKFINSLFESHIIVIFTIAIKTVDTYTKNWIEGFCRIIGDCHLNDGDGEGDRLNFFIQFFLF